MYYNETNINHSSRNSHIMKTNLDTLEQGPCLSATAHSQNLSRRLLQGLWRRYEGLHSLFSYLTEWSILILFCGWQNTLQFRWDVKTKFPCVYLPMFNFTVYSHSKILENRSPRINGKDLCLELSIRQRSSRTNSANRRFIREARSLSWGLGLQRHLLWWKEEAHMSTANVYLKGRQSYYNKLSQGTDLQIGKTECYAVSFASKTNIFYDHCLINAWREKIRLKWGGGRGGGQLVVK